MDVQVHDKLALVSTLIRRESYHEALVSLRKLGLAEIRSLTSIELSEFYYLHGRCLYHLGDHRKGLAKTRVAVQLSQTSSNHSLYASQKRLLGSIFWASGSLDDAIEAHNEAYVSFRRAEEHKKICGSLVDLGLVHFLKGDLGQACRVFKSALTYAKDYNTAAEVNICKRNLCLPVLLMGNFKEFQTIFESISADPESESDHARATELSAKYEVYNLNPDKAHEALEEALAFYERESYKREQVVCSEYLGLNEYFQGNYGKAKEYFLQILGRDGLRTSAIAQTLRMLTDVYIAEGDFPKAKETAAKAEEAITKIGERIELGALYRALGQIYGHEGDDKKASEYFAKSADLLCQLGARYELALSHLAMGRSSIYCEETRIEHLREAKMLFSEMEVPKRVTQVEEAISKLVRSGSPLSVGLVTTKHSSVLTFKRSNEKSHGSKIITQDKAMLEAINLVDRLKNTDMTILITGETGTGKDLLAEYIHFTSDRRSKPYRAVNSAAIPENLLETELFGSKRGTFTGAIRDKVGLIEAADGGTFYIDEVCEAPLSVQTKLLRVLETKTVRALGEVRDIAVDVRFIAASNQNLAEKVENGQFRPDLYYRLQGITIELPPLRDRVDDIPLLLKHFMTELGLNCEFLSDCAWDRLCRQLKAYSWPGNVRELKSAVGRARAMVVGDRLDDICDVLWQQFEKANSPSTLKKRMETALAHHSGNVSKAAKELGIHEATLRYHLKKNSK